MTELYELSTLEQAAAIRAGDVSPVELTGHHLERAERIGPVLGAFITLTPERALEQARIHEQALWAASRNGSQDELPPLLGVPVPIKDLNNVAGVRTTFGSIVYAEFVPAVDDHVACRLAVRSSASMLVLHRQPRFSEFGA